MLRATVPRYGTTNIAARGGGGGGALSALDQSSRMTFERPISLLFLPFSYTLLSSLSSTTISSPQQPTLILFFFFFFLLCAHPSVRPPARPIIFCSSKTHLLTYSPSSPSSPALSKTQDRVKTKTKTKKRADLEAVKSRRQGGTRRRTRRRKI